MKRHSRFDSADVVLVQSTSHSIDRINSCGPDCNYFRNQRIIIWRHGVAGINVRVDANAAATWRIIKIDAARRWLEVVGRIFALMRHSIACSRGAARADILRKRLARSDADLLLYEIASINFLRDGVLTWMVCSFP